MHYCTDRVVFQWSPGWHAAREYAALGWRVFPVWGVVGGVCTCRSRSGCGHPGKHPRIRGNLRKATTNLKTAWDWWFDWPEANVAVATGQESGVIVLDVDPRNRGDKTMMALCKELGPLPPSPAVCTPGEGWHLYFQCPQDELLRSKAGPGVDIKADGGYVAAPPSRTDEGTYRWSVHPGDCPPPPLPPAWLVKITKPKILQFVSLGQELDTLTWGSGGIIRASSNEYVEQAIRRTLPNATGTRNDCLKRFLVLLKRHPELAGLPVESIRLHVEKWHIRALPKIKDRNFDKSTWKEAKSLWPKVDPRLQGIDRLATVAFQQEPPGFVRNRHYKLELVKLVLLCRALQHIWGDEPFPLDCRKARDLIGVRSPQTAINYLGTLEQDDVLRCIRRGNYRKRHASEWRYLHPVGE